MVYYRSTIIAIAILYILYYTWYILPNLPYFGGTVPIFDVKNTAFPLFLALSHFFGVVFLAFFEGKKVQLPENPIDVPFFHQFCPYFWCFEVGTYEGSIS